MYRVFLLVILFLANTSKAIGADIPQLGVKQPKSAGIQVLNQTTGELITKIIRNSIVIIYSIAAVAFVIMILWGATEWIFSGGDKEKLAHARKRITTAIVGIVILSLAFLIINIVGQITGVKFGGEIQIPNFVSPI